MLGILLKEMKGQKLVTTHSGHLVADVDLFSLRRLCRKNGEIHVFQLPRNLLSDEEEIRKLNYHVRATRGDLLFARCWLLIEGKTEYLIFNECAHILGYDLYAEGVFCVEYTQSGGPKPLLKFANGMGIDWCFVADADKAGQDYIRTADKYLNGKTRDQHIFTLPNDNMEEFLCNNGYVDVYERFISDQKIQTNQITASQGSVDYYKQLLEVCENNFKIPAAHEVISKIQQCGSSGVPPLIKNIIEKSRKIARQAG